MEGYEKEDSGVDIEGALDRLDSSEEALDLEEGIGAFTDKWSSDPELKEHIAWISEKKDEDETRGVLAALVAMGGAGAAMFGIHDDLKQYMDANTYDLAEVVARIGGTGTLLMSAQLAWSSFKDSFAKAAKISSLRNS
jgi:hypothetical protein